MRKTGDEQKTARLELRARLEQQLADFEKQYTMKSVDFYKQFEHGDLGDAADFVEWSATFEMLENLRKQLGTHE